MATTLANKKILAAGVPVLRQHLCTRCHLLSDVQERDGTTGWPKMKSDVGHVFRYHMDIWHIWTMAHRWFTQVYSWWFSIGVLLFWYFMMFTTDPWWNHFLIQWIDTGRWFGTWIYFPSYIGNVIILTDFHSIIFFRGVGDSTTKQYHIDMDTVPSGKLT